MCLLLILSNKLVLNQETRFTIKLISLNQRLPHFGCRHTTFLIYNLTVFEVLTTDMKEKFTFYQ